MDFRRIPHPEAGLLGYLGSWSKVRVEDSPPRVQVLPTHHSPTPERSRAFLEWLRETAGGIGRVAPADHSAFEDEPCGPDGGVWAGPGGLAWFIDSPADLRRLAAFMRQHSEAAGAATVAYKYLHRLKEVEGLLEQLPPQPAQGDLDAPAASRGARPPRRCDCCGRQGIPLKLCAACESKRYCSRECQRRSWVEQGHREQCAELATAKRR